MENLNNGFNVSLPKWSGMWVEGKRVTVEQAGEIILATDNWYISAHEGKWLNEFIRVTGMDPSAPYEYQDSYEKRMTELVDGLKVYGLRNQRINSAYINGLHGWCDWDGTIGCSSYNIGKWNTVETVLDEWQTIAEAFPFLDLVCHLYDGEVCEENIKPIVEYVICNGKVSVGPPTRSSAVKEYCESFFNTVKSTEEFSCCDIGYFEKAWNRRLGNS